MEEKVTLTIFTPTYNRAYTLPRLYKSLCNQSDEDFNWIIVDDGSTDNTKKLVNTWINEKNVNIIYVYQENAGKMKAHNEGVRLAQSLLFTCVDSDDYLVESAVEKIKTCYKENNIDLGMLFKRGKNQNTPITSWKGSVKYATMYEAETEKGLRGDSMLVFRTDVLKQHYFPVFIGEKFVPESYLYDQLSKVGKLYFSSDILYLCEYFSDGYTANMRKTNARNPQGYIAYIEQRLEMDYKLTNKVKDTIRYIAIKCVAKDNQMIQRANNRFLAAICFLPGYLFYRKEYYKYVRAPK